MKTIAALTVAAGVATAQYNGQGTFYGQGGAGQSGACMLNRGFNGVGLTVAINGRQWDNGMNCGKCIKVTGTGQGIGTTPVFGPIYATIDNVCSECNHGDIDLGLQGDGIWQINWHFVDCGEARGSGSVVPVKQEVGTAALPVAGHFLAPGNYVTVEGIKSVGAPTGPGKRSLRGSPP